MTEPEDGTPTLEELLAAHAAGRLPTPLRTAVALHLALSPRAQTLHALFEAVGGALLERLPPAPLEPDTWERMMVRLDEGAAIGRRPAPPESLSDLLRCHLGVDLRMLTWRPDGEVFTAELASGDDRHAMWLLRIPAGKAVTRHGHEGLEIGVVLEGACRDERGRFGCGDIFIADRTVVHGPISDLTRDCMCLMVMRSEGLRAEAGP